MVLNTLKYREVRTVTNLVQWMPWIWISVILWAISGAQQTLASWGHNSNLEGKGILIWLKLELSFDPLFDGWLNIK